jgi:hypothetical protein
MAVDPSVRIDIAAEFTGKKAFKQADTSTAQLSKNVKNLAKTFGVAFSTAKVLAYAKASIRAAAADQKAQQQLALALKNVGLGRDAATAEGYIQRIEKEFGIIDDKLRPAYTKLAIATRNTAETERLMGIAMDISANSGKDLESVTAALSKAYLGNNATLSKLGIGISKADLKTKSFKEITDQLAVTFAGAAKTSADSFSGSMDKLAIASNNAKEIIGTSLINALQSLGDDDSISTLGADIEGAAKSLANFVNSIVYLKEQVKSIPGAGIFGYLFSGVTDLLGRFSPQRLTELLKAIKGFQGMGNVPMTGGSNMDTQKFEAAQKTKIKADKLIADNKIKADKLAAANKAKLDKAAAVFDLQKIQIAAALKGKISEEEKIRLLLMQAIEEGNAEKAEVLQKKLEKIQELNAKIAADLLAIGEATDPFADWVLSLGAAAAILGKMPALLDATGSLTGRGKVTLPKGDGLPSANDSIFTPDMTAAEIADAATAAADMAVAAAESAVAAVIAADPIVNAIAETANALTGITDIVTNVPETITATGSSSMFNPHGVTPGSSAGYGNAINNNYVTIEVAGSVLTENDFDDVINRAMLNNIRRGLTQSPAGSLPG